MTKVKTNGEMTATKMSIDNAMCKHGITATQVKLARPRADGRTHAPVDPCIAPLVQALNDAGLQTTSSCCGHGHRPGIVTLADGREILIMRDHDEAARTYPLWPDIHGNEL